MQCLCVAGTILSVRFGEAPAYVRLKYMSTSGWSLSLGCGREQRFDYTTFKYSQNSCFLISQFSNEVSRVF